MSSFSEPSSLAPEPERPDARSQGAARRLRRRRRALRRFDILLGLIVGAIWLLVAPGVAMAGIVAVLVLALAGVSVLVARRRARRRSPRRLRRRRRGAGR